MEQAEQIKRLHDFFKAEEHEFLNGYIYLTEEAINRRLTEVDPDWSFTGGGFEVNGDCVAANRTLTIRGVSRSNVGFGTIQRAKWNKEKKVWEDLTALAVAENTGNAYKGAVTDALKRCARLHGVGLYILDIPTSGQHAVTDMAGLKLWLAAKQGNPVQNAPKSQKKASPRAAGDTPPASPPEKTTTPWNKENAVKWANAKIASGEATQLDLLLALGGIASWGEWDGGTVESAEEAWQNYLDAQMGKKLGAEVALQ